MSSGDSGKRKRQSTDASSITLPAKRLKASKGISITIPALKRKAPANATPGAGPSSERDAGATDASSVSRTARVKQSGLQIWNAVRAAKSKEGYDVAFDFLKLPPKRLYQDYYKVIKRPICLDDIKGRLDNSLYPTLKAVKDDLDLCFNNAFTYNMEHSPIWEAAKTMQKITNKEYKTLSQQEAEDEEVDVGESDPRLSNTLPAVGPEAYDGVDDDEDDEDEDNDDADEEYDASGSKKAKSSHGDLSSLLSTRLQKLITKAPKDEGGGLISDPFLVLPSKKDWPQYYQLIKRPIAFDVIQRKLKKKAYATSAEFAADIELLFDNALLFNEDNTPVWLAAQTLRPMFHKLMADLPPEHAWTKPQAPKIKLKVQHPKAAPAPLPSPPTPQPPSTPRAVPKPQATPARKPPPPPVTPAAQTPAARPSPAATPTPHPPPKPAYQHQQSAQYHQPAPQAPRTSSNIVYQPQPLMPTASGQATPPVPPRSPTPDTIPTTIIRSVSVTATPSRRTIQLLGTPFGDEEAASVRCFSVRLGWNENSVRLGLEAERNADEDVDAAVSEAEPGPSVIVDGKRFPVEIKCNGTFVSPATKAPSATPTPATTQRSLTPVEDGADENGHAKMNGHGDENGGESDSESDDGGDVGAAAARATRSGRVPTSNGKAKRRKRKGAASRVLLDLGQWDVSLNIGHNVVDIKAGGREGESWRVFVDRSM